jgi:pyruvate/2-oxoglutarate dehydrogenase complex dihydrolipoamide dehydrogenase (E3) component
VGGALRLAAATPVLAHLAHLVRWFERRLSAAGVEVRAGLEADARVVAGLGADLVVLACGARTATPVLEGYDRLPTWTLEDLLAGEPSSLGTTGPPARPAVLGGGQRGLALALWLAARGAAVSVISDRRLGWDTSGLAARALLARLDGAGAALVAGRPHEIDGRGVVVRTDDGERLIMADAAVIAEPVHPASVAGLDGARRDVVAVGDAKDPRDVASAIAEARELVEAFTLEAAGRGLMDTKRSFGRGRPAT